MPARVTYVTASLSALDFDTAVKNALRQHGGGALADIIVTDAEDVAPEGEPKPAFGAARDKRIAEARKKAAEEKPAEPEPTPEPEASEPPADEAPPAEPAAKPKKASKKKT